jgi:septum formation inhibitor MinC
MATRKKVKAKAKTKTKATRKNRTVSKATRRKTGTVRKRVAKKATRRPTAKKARPPTTTGKPRPVRARASEAIKPPPSRPATPISSEQRIGVVSHYYSHLSVVAMQLEPGATLRAGDVIHIWGHTTDFTQKVESLEVNHAPVTEVGAKDDFGLKVIEHAREHDLVFKVRS